MSSARHGLRLVNCWFLTLLSLVFFSLAASAQKIGDSAAQALFEEARQLMLDDRPLEACPKFEESLRLDPALGTLLNLALCHEKQGKAATAYLEYTDAVAQSVREGDRERQALAQERAVALEPRVIRLSLRVAFAPPKGFWVELDGTRFEAAALDVALPVDPGPHLIRYGAPGRRSRESSVFALERERRPALVLAELEALEAPPEPKPVFASGTAVTTTERSNTRSLVTGALIGGGLAALVFGTYSGIEAGRQWSKRNEHCPDGCDRNASLYGDNAQRFATLSNGSIALGLAAIGVGVYLFATKPNEAPRAGAKLSAALQQGRGMVVIEGSL